MDPIDSSLVEVCVPFGLRDGSLVEIHSRDCFGTPQEFRGQREAARVAAQIQDSTPLREGRQASPILPLVTEESSLVSLLEVDFVPDAMFRNPNAPDLIGRKRTRLKALMTCDEIIDLDDPSSCP